MSIINDHEIYAVYYTNEERSTITTELVNPEPHETIDSTLNIIHHTFPAEEDNPDFIALLKKVSIDQINENTINKYQKEREDFEALILNIAGKQGELGSIIGEKSSAQIINDIVQLITKEMDEEDLFRFKLNLFEHEIVQNSKAKTKKTNLRKSRTAKEALKIFLDF
jgi:hypothetical protein|tara:strand:- start:567 stop:1067 length:501 start_codon:yes stop_codon:yes gene_type:complete